MMSAPPIVSRYGELHREELRAEVRRDRLAATCTPNPSAMRRTTRRARIAASSLLATLFAGASRVPPASGRSDPATRGAL